MVNSSNTLIRTSFSPWDDSCTGIIKLFMMTSVFVSRSSIQQDDLFSTNIDANASHVGICDSDSISKKNTDRCRRCCRCCFILLSEEDRLKEENPDEMKDAMNFRISTRTRNWIRVAVID
mmetsp:Transcript_10396/g.13159  ORF Transcript_10396/g.13159 Transcript_10396/m.13159 type:complete len:120 (+) Transcript_10396:796-1155(+)